MGHVPCLHLKKILVAPQIISTDFEMSPAVYMLWANNVQYQSICFAPDASFAIPFYILGVPDVQVGLKYVETIGGELQKRLRVSGGEYHLLHRVGAEVRIFMR